MERQTYLRQLAARLEEWDNKLDQLGATTEQLDEKARSELRAQINALREKRQDLLRRFEEMRGAGEEAFDDLKVGATVAWDDIERAWTDIRQAAEQAIERFRGASSRETEKT